MAKPGKSNGASSPQHREKLQRQLRQWHEEVARESLSAALQDVVNRIGRPAAQPSAAAERPTAKEEAPPTLIPRE